MVDHDDRPGSLRNRQGASQPGGNPGIDDDRQVDVVWDMSAMEGTGSNDMICDGSFVPDHRIVEVPGFVEGRTEGNQRYDNPLYLMPVLPFMYSEVISVMVGGLEGATQHYIDMLRGEDPAYSPGKLAEMPTVHVKMGEAASRSRTARKLMDSLIDETVEIQQSRAYTMDDRLRLKLDAGTIANHCRQSINELIHDAGARSFENDSPIQAHFRDINALSVHAFWDWHVCREQYGRGQVGLERNELFLQGHRLSATQSGESYRAGAPQATGRPR